MKELENVININLTKTEYEYLENLCTSMYRELSKLPKKMRTSKFYTLENIVKNHFTK